MRAPRAKARGPVWEQPLRRSSDRSLHFCRGGTLGRPVPWAGMPVGRGLLDAPCPAPPPCLHGAAAFLHFTPARPPERSRIFPGGPSTFGVFYAKETEA